MKKSALLYFCFLILLCTSCSVNKFIPKDKYLLDNVKIESDTKDLRSDIFTTFIRQNPNTKWFNLVKVPMRLYCISGKDSTKFYNKFFRKIGDTPVIYNPDINERTRIEIEKAVQNSGYMSAKVIKDEHIKKNKIDIIYKIEAGKPYYIRNIVYDFEDLTINDIFQKNANNSFLRKGMKCDVNVLEKERQRISSMLQDNGYYKFNKDFITFIADTTSNDGKIDLTMKLLPYIRQKEDIPQRHKQYKVSDVHFILNNKIDNISKTDLVTFDSLKYNGNTIYYKDHLFLRPNVILNFNRLKSHDYFSETEVKNTYASLGRLRALKYSNIKFTEKNDSLGLLDAYIQMVNARNKSVSFEIEGTNSAGDLGAAASVGFYHKNVFKGSELFTIKLRGAYEAITGLQGGFASDNYNEYGIESSLKFPDFKFPFLSKDFRKKIYATSEVGVKYNSQIRPEFSRTSASASWSYKWIKNFNNHKYDLIDINYVYMPSKSDYFKNYLENMTGSNSLLKYSYEDQLIVRTGYSFNYNSAGQSLIRKPSTSSYSVRFAIEEAGNLLYCASKLANSKPKSDQGFVIANIPFAQYVKSDIDFTRNVFIDKRNSIVFHVATGVAVAYGNSKMLPFEKRYFAGGANGVRGWSVRSLGPGAFQGGENGSLDFINYTGDIKLDLNLEYRTFLFWKFNGAAFVDAGNIWNIRENKDQKGGMFKFNSFYKQLAFAYGLGLRLDLDFLILRFDGGMKAINPMKTGRDKYPIISPRLGRDFAFHFAVGYPF